MRFVSKINGVESEEILWKYSPKSWGMLPLQNFCMWFWTFLQA